MNAITIKGGEWRHPKLLGLFSDSGRGHLLRSCNDKYLILYQILKIEFNCKLGGGAIGGACAERPSPMEERFA
jgi:hypothetical protein